MSWFTSSDGFVETLLQLYSLYTFFYEHASVQLKHTQQPTAVLQIETYSERVKWGRNIKDDDLFYILKQTYF